MTLPSKLCQTSENQVYQRLLTVEFKACSGVLELFEGLVLFEALSKVLGGLCVEFVARQTANESRIGVSAAADTRNGAGDGVLERCEGLVLLESASEVLGGLGVEVVARETVNEARSDVSAAADSRNRGVRRRT